jgi:catechol 2,3-dioxygenase-like lactoylglutathione lyase family enzyme
VISVSSLSCIVLICRDAERLAEFYTHAFGFVPLNDSPKSEPGFGSLIGVANGQVRMKKLRLGGQYVGLAQPEPCGRRYPDNVPGWDPLFQHFAIVVSDMATAVAALRVIPGWTAISIDGPQTLPASSGGATAFKFRDPEGHPLELLAFSPAAKPSNWATRSAKACLGIDHSAISVADTGRSVAFYNGLGLTCTAGSLNVGPEQQKLDGIADAVVEVTALTPTSTPTHSVPHVELLCYRGNFDRRKVLANADDVAATQLVFAAARDAYDVLIERNRAAIVHGPIVSELGASHALLRDPDGHWICLQHGAFQDF